MIIDKIEKTILPGVLKITPNIFEDSRGYFFEFYNKDDFKKHDIPYKYVQDNQAFSTKNVLRGLHYQLNYPQGKLVRVVQGEVYDVAVDIRRSSPTFGKSFGMVLSDKNLKMMYIPEGFAHGYVVLSDTAIFQYKCTKKYHPNDDHGIRWDDPDLAIDWPVKNPILSKKDIKLPILKSMELNKLPELKK